MASNCIVISCVWVAGNSSLVWINSIYKHWLDKQKCETHHHRNEMGINSRLFGWKWEKNNYGRCFLFRIPSLVKSDSKRKRKRKWIEWSGKLADLRPDVRSNMQHHHFKLRSIEVDFLPCIFGISVGVCVHIFGILHRMHIVLNYITSKLCKAMHTNQISRGRTLLHSEATKFKIFFSFSIGFSFFFSKTKFNPGSASIFHYISNILWNSWKKLRSFTKFSPYSFIFN